MAQDPFASYYQPPATELDNVDVSRVRHSGLGLASFFISLLTGLGEIALVVAAGYMQAKTPGGMNPQDPQTILLGLLLLGGLAIAFLGAGLGLGGLFQKNRNRIFAVLGLVFNFMILIAIVGLMVIGMVMKAQK